MLPATKPTGMTRLPAHLIGNARASTFVWDRLKRLVDIENRMAGHEGEMQADEAVHSTFEEIELEDASIHEFELLGWWRESSAIAAPDCDGRFTADH